jgi:hypothetical protein
MTSLLAMLYLVLISTLAIGFYASTTVSSQLSNNDSRVARAYMASETGMDFMRRQLAKVRIPANTAPGDVLDNLYAALQTQLNGTSNLSGGNISRSGNTISIPASGTIKLDSGNLASFSITITDWAGEIVVKSDGKFGTASASRAITMDFTRQQRNGTVFDNAVVSAGQILVSKGTITGATGIDPAIATMMSILNSTPAISISGGEVGGKLTILDTAGVSVTGGTVHGDSTPSAILANDVTTTSTPPEMPTFDPTVFRSYATNSWVNGAKTQSNIYIPPNSNPKFNGGDTVQGVMYIDSPNQVTFMGNFNLKGFIVMAAKKSDGTVSNTDSLSFSGNLTMSPLPNLPQFDSLRSVSGIAIMAPNAAISMTGSSGGNTKGSIIGKTYEWSGASDFQVDQGTIMTMKASSNSAYFHSSKAIKFTATGSSNPPSSGVSYSQYFLPKPASFQEVSP